MMEISNSLSRITAAGFFDIDLQLITTVIQSLNRCIYNVKCSLIGLQLIGTTLTYLIILFQFQTSENS